MSSETQIALPREDGKVRNSEVEFLRTELASAQEAVREWQERYGNLFSRMPSGYAKLALCDESLGTLSDMVVLTANPAFELHTGLPVDRVIDRKVSEIMTGLGFPWLRAGLKCLTSGQPTQVEGYLMQLGRYIEASFFSPEEGKLAVIFRDISKRVAAEAERDRLREKVDRAERLKGFNNMAVSVAHNFNNMLTIVVGNLDLSLQKLPPGPVHEMIESASRGVWRAADLSRLMLTYLGQHFQPLAPVSVNTVARDAFKTFCASAPDGVHVSLRCDGQDHMVGADTQQLEQAMAALFTNALESIPPNRPASEAGDGWRVEIGIAAGSQFCTSEFLQESVMYDGQKPGEYAFIEVSDDGCGMPSDVLRKACDPFFTTKFVGRGMGLAVVLGVVRSHNGVLTIESQEDKGTKIRLYLPCGSEC